MNDELLNLIKHEKVQERLRPVQDRDYVHLDNPWSNDPIIYPMAIDPIEPERGVWSWIDHSAAIIINNDTGVLSARFVNKTGFWIGDPLTVLLKVFLYQQGVDI